MKLNVKKTVGAGTLALALTVSGGAFAANAQMDGGQNHNVIKENGTAAVYMTAADRENDSRVAKDGLNEILLSEDGTAAVYMTAADRENDSRVAKDGVIAEGADSGMKYLPKGDNLVRDDTMIRDGGMKYVPNGDNFVRDDTTFGVNRK